MKKEKWLLIFIALATCIYFIQPMFTWFKADDFCIMNQVQKIGIFSGMWDDYMHWDGRSLCLTYPVSRIGLFYGVAWLGPFIGSLLLILLSVVILRLSGIRGAHWLSKVKNLAILTVLLWLVSFNFSSQTIYWSTGIGYNLELILVLLAAVFIYVPTGNRMYYLLGIPVFFYAGTVSPNGSLAILFIFGLQFVHNYLNVKKEDNKKILFAGALVIIGLVVVLASPGNSRRMVALDRNNYTHIWTIYFNIKLLFTNLWNYNTLFTWILMFIGIAGATLEFAEVKRQKSWNPASRFFLFLHAHKWFLAAIISFIFFLPLPGMHSPRTNIYFAIFMVVYALGGLKYLLPLIPSDYRTGIFRNLAFALLAVFIVIASSQAFDARYCKAQMQNRISLFENNKGGFVTLDRDDIIRPPKTRDFEDLSADSAYWINDCTSNYFGLKGLKMEIEEKNKPGHR